MSPEPAAARIVSDLRSHRQDGINRLTPSHFRILISSSGLETASGEWSLSSRRSHKDCSCSPAPASADQLQVQGIFPQSHLAFESQMQALSQLRICLAGHWRQTHNILKAGIHGTYLSHTWFEYGGTCSLPARRPLARTGRLFRLPLVKCPVPDTFHYRNLVLRDQKYTKRSSTSAI